MTYQRDTRYSIADLAQEGQVSRRTVRYYVQRGLLPAPMGTGRGNHYTQEHLERLIQVRKWQEDGVSLAAIQRRLNGEPETPTVRPAVSGLWHRFQPHPGIELHVHAETRLDEAEIERILTKLRSALGERS